MLKLCVLVMWIDLIMNMMLQVALAFMGDN